MERKIIEGLSLITLETILSDLRTQGKPKEYDYVYQIYLNKIKEA